MGEASREPEPTRTLTNYPLTSISSRASMTSTDMLVALILLAYEMVLG